MEESPPAAAAAPPSTSAAAPPPGLETGEVPLRPRRRRRRADLSLPSLAGLVMLGAWAWLWVQSFIGFQLATLSTWIPVWTYLGLDLMHCVFAVRVMFNGDNPYVVDAGDFRGAFTAPPIVLGLFTWTWFFNAYNATLIWTIVIAATITWAVEQCRRVREALGLWVPPLLLAVAVLLWSYPVLFSIERSNLDVWVLITLFIAIPLLRRGTIGAELMAGVMLAIGAWAKIYPGLLMFALLTFGRWRASLAMFVMIVLIGVVPLEATRGFFRNSNQPNTQNRVVPLVEVVQWLGDPTFEQRPWRRQVYFEHYGHSIVTYWQMMFGYTPLGTFPSFLGATIILGAMLLYGTYEVRRSPRRELLVLPYFLWVIALGTYGLPISYDYNLFFLLLVALALWDRRDPWWVHLSMIPVLVWWQPFAFGISSELFVWTKFLAVIPVTVLLVRRAREGDVHGLKVVPQREEGLARTPAPAPAPAATPPSAASHH